MKKNFTKLVSLPLSALLLLGSTGCSLPKLFFREKKIAAAEISKEYSRKATDEGEISDTFKNGLADFSFRFLQGALTKDEKNDLVSPLSAALCMALINNGAAGNTKKQIEDLFGGMSTDELNSSLYAYTSALPSTEDCKMSLANSVWIKENTLNVNPAFLQANADWYNAEAYLAPFNQTTVKDINNWCYNHTTGKIEKILDTIPPLAVMYLINTVDFDGKWETKYEREDIENGIFHNYNGTEKDVKMLYSQEHRYLMDEDTLGFVKNYKGSHYSFVGLLPNEGIDVYEYIDGLSAEKWTALWESANPQNEGYEYREVHARMPEFTYETEMELNGILQALGVTDMFSPDLADFSGIDDTHPLYCDMVKQKTFIQHDRNGTKAAAITIGGMKCMSAAPAEPLYITLDRPFVYAIVDNQNKLPLFLGAITNL
ncbi:MAG: serpin family protein [Clostridia bacterium]|nr:serpin family protein [Clostridia bacterium]